MMEFTHKTIQALSVTKRDELADESYRHGKRRRGLMVQANVSGNHRFLYQRMVGGKKYKFTLGRFPELGLAEAREMVDAINDYDGTPKEAWDALKPKDEDKNGDVLTVEKLINQYVEECEVIRKNRDWKGQERVLKKELKPYLHMPAEDLTKVHVLAVVNACIDRGSERTAHEALKQIKGMYARAMNQHRKRNKKVEKGAVVATIVDKWLDISMNPAAGVEVLKYKPKSHHFDTKALKVFPSKLQSSDIRGDVKDILLIQLQTFCRVGEVAGMSWKELDLKKGEWVIPGERYKTGDPHTVMLSKQTIKRLKEIKKKTESEYVFPMPRFPEKAMTSAEVAHRINYVRDSLKVDEDFSSHSLRRSGSTWLAAQNPPCPYEVKERLLGHKIDTEGDMAERYNKYKYMDERKEWTQKWCDYLEGKL
ncbi:tyrosine-type recombinase/integrase [Pseudohalioglobus lutimaris]|uniref:Tyr recombinase domain-containing protein n=1 Tax=Pseudohalioglobus lutimaris TaxID=1737061 RepID=A0A2N5X4M8_9GAMM|nr:site-specific integrase [Pseudohalioglobus lutimaris]PLW69444.1 hypothetical protein C0039_07920 [Pseudohalioglobus lutimaris]